MVLDKSVGHHRETGALIVSKLANTEDRRTNGFPLARDLQEKVVLEMKDHANPSW